ncbi:uncharacterized protein LOC142590254 isoform X2 [Dermacentor variabilis]|uniref:uncharacterized protein LOC142590254 isoform X2 n=1 Tax=Dermacentor variabilis TaxID=34621 RepID=UPI003F5C6AAB
MAPGANGQRVTRSRSRRQKAVTSTISGGIQQNFHTGEHSVQQDSDQQDLLGSVVTKTTRSNRQGKKVQMPEGSPINKSRDTGITPPAHFDPSQSTKTNLVPPTEKRKTRKKLSPATSGSKAVRSSNRLGTRKKPSSEKEALGSNTFKESRQDVQTNACALKRQQISDNVQTDSQKSTLQTSLGDAETSTLVCERNRERKRTAQALPHHESSEEGEGASAQPPIERKKSKGKRPLSKASNAEAVPSSSKAKTILTRSSSQEEQSLRGVASKQVRQDVQTSGHASKEQHMLDNSNSRSLRSRNQAYGRANPQAGRPAPEGAGGILSLRDTETSRPVCERNAKRKKTAQALRHHEPSEKGESTSDRPPTERKKSKKKWPSSEASNAEAVPSSSRTKTILTRSSSQEEQSFWGVASKQVQQDVQTSGHASNEQHTLDNSNSRSLRSRNKAYGRANPQAGRLVPEGAGEISSLRDAEASRPVCERNAKRKKTAEAHHHHEPSEKGESTSAQPPTEKRKSKKQPSSEASNAEAAPSSSRAKTILTRSSSQEEQSFWGVASKQVRQDVQTSGHTSNEEHTLSGSLSFTLRSRNQAGGRANPRAGRSISESAAGTTSQPPQPLRHKMDREKLRARPRRYPKRKFGHEPVFVLEDTESSHRTTSPSSRDEVDASLPLSPIPVCTLPEGGHAGKLGFHWYEATFGALREHAKVAELERSDDDIKSLHWVSDTEWPTDAHQTEDDDSSDVSSGDDFTLPWDKDRLWFSGQSSQDQEPGQETEGLDHWQKDARRRVQAYLPGVRVTKRAWETIYQWYLGTADPYKLWALADELLPAELLQRLYPATPCLLSSKSPE